MPIARGEPWGSPAPRPVGAPEARTDAELAALIDHDGPIVVLGGELHRSLGSPPRRDPVQLLPVDVITARLDGREHVAVAHLVARRSWWRGPLLAVMNVGSLGSWDVAPRAHPNDGRVDVVEVDAAMTLRARWQARSRLRLGTHVPHPAIRTSATRSAEWHFDRAVSVRLDGEEVGRARHIEVVVRPDAVTVAV